MPMPHDHSDPTPLLRALPQERAFLVQLAVDAVPAAGTVRGRAVHIRTGEAAPFESVAELLHFLEVHLQPAPATRKHDATA